MSRRPAAAAARRPTTPLALLALAGLAAAAPAPAARAQGLEYVKAHYTKSEHLVPMRDGKRLFTVVYAPKEARQPLPVLLFRTPYSVGPYGADSSRASLGPSERFARDGYIFVYQDVRGRYLSEGEFVDVRPHRDRKGPRDVDESSDTFDTVDWIVKRVPGTNGRVGLWGISYPGFYAAAALPDAHPALKAVSPQAPISDWFMGDDFHHNGALFLVHAFNFFSSFGKPRPEPTVRSAGRFEHGTADGYDFFLKLEPLARIEETLFKGSVAFWTGSLEHDSYDAFWQARNIRPHLRQVRPAVLTVGGWFDAEDLYGALEIYRAIERQGARGPNTLVMGPWVHGGWARTAGDGLGSVRFDARTADFYRDQIELPFFQHHLKDAPDPRLPEAYVFETGRNEWHALPAWPPRTAVPRALWLDEAGRLAFTPPRAEGADEYASDPGKPVPYVEDVVISMVKEYMVADQRFAARRPDVLVWQTPPLEQDLTVAGPIKARLRVSTTGTDADFVVKLCDVYPDGFPEPPPLAPPLPAPGAGAAPAAGGAGAAAAPGSTPAGAAAPPAAGTSGSQPSKMGGYQQLVRGEPFRGRFRRSFEKPEPFVPGEKASIDFALPDVFHTFRRGHRVMVQVQSSWFPLVDLNPQTFVPIARAKAADFQRATHRVYRGGKDGSRLEILVTRGLD